VILEAEEEYDEMYEGYEPSETQGYEAWDMPSTSENSIEFSTSNRYEAGVMLADINEGYEPSDTLEIEAREVPLNTNGNSNEFLKPYGCEASLVPPNANEGSEEPSPITPGLPSGCPDILSCNEQLGNDTGMRSHHGTSMPWRRGAKLPFVVILPAIDSVACRHSRMAVGHRMGVG